MISAMYPSLYDAASNVIRSTNSRSTNRCIGIECLAQVVLGSLTELTGVVWVCELRDNING